MLYSKMDVLQLADVFENFVESSTREDNVNHLCSYSLPGSLQDTTFTSVKSLLKILKRSIREFSLAPSVLFFVLILPICMF